MLRLRLKRNDCEIPEYIPSDPKLLERGSCSGGVTADISMRPCIADCGVAPIKWLLLTLCAHWEYRILNRKRSSLARPYIRRLSILVTWI